MHVKTRRQPCALCLSPQELCTISLGVLLFCFYDFVLLWVLFVCFEVGSLTSLGMTD